MEYTMHYLSQTNVLEDRALAVAGLLNKQMADTLDLRSQARQSYFNARGPYLEELRSLFDGLARDLRQVANVIAQRINDAGGYAIITVRSVADQSGLRDYPLDAVDARDQLEVLRSNHLRYELDTRQNMRAAREIGDSPTALLFQFILSAIENNLWFLEAYLEGIGMGLDSSELPAWTSTLFNQSRIDWNESAGSFRSVSLR
jgi:starvation-inducible DNA-binding protein